MDGRKSQRFTVTIPGRYRTASGLARNIALQDLSPEGARFFERHTTLVVGYHITLWVQSLGPFEASVKWVHDGEVGILFASPLYAPIFDHIRVALDNPEWR